MEAVWYMIVALMLTTYVVLDGFDFGAGILHLFVARSDAERRQVLSAIGPYWNGNEVWLVASGGLLVFAFPRVYAAGFSGFYLPLMMVLWLLIFRGISIEFRSKEDNPLWRTLWDTVFSGSSLFMSIVLGAALGNVIRGVPLSFRGYFDGPLFTNFVPGPHPGVLDWYTVSVGVFASLVLAGHGALFLSWKTADSLRDRCTSVAEKIWPAILATGALITCLTYMIRPAIYHSLIARPWTWLLAILVIVGLAAVFWALRKGRERAAFLGSVVFMASLLAATAAGMYPNMLISTLDPAFTLTADNSANSTSGLTIGIVWWAPTVVLAVLYFVHLFRTFAGKVSEDVYDH